MTPDQLASEYLNAVAAMQQAQAQLDRVLTEADKAGVSYNQLCARVEQLIIERDGRDLQNVED